MVLKRLFLRSLTHVVNPNRDFCSRFGLVRNRTISEPFNDRPQRYSKPRKLNRVESLFRNRVNRCTPVFSSARLNLNFPSRSAKAALKR